MQRFLQLVHKLKNSLESAILNSVMRYIFHFTWRYDMIITYLIFINLTSLLLMGIDKYKAIHHKWRISEKTLFISALLFGSIGALLGMYTFRHKTKHAKFVYGMPTILIVQIILVIFLYYNAALPNLFPVTAPS